LVIGLMFLLWRYHLSRVELLTTNFSCKSISGLDTDS
jgi:hypothetical protein